MATISQTNTAATPGGFIKLHRKLLSNPVWTQLAPAVAKVLVYFLLRANHRPSQWYDQRARQTIPIPAGSFITSYVKVSQACAISMQQARDAFEHLNGTHFATYRRTYRWTLVTVMNWSTYQGREADENIVENTEETSPRTFLEHSENTRQEVKKEKNEEEVSQHLCATNGVARVGDEPFSLESVGPKSPAVKGNGPTSEQSMWFAAWWPEYPRHVAKKPAEAAFRKLVKTEARFQQVMAATRAQRPAMLEREAEKIPYPATWLNQERWNDEPASAAAPQKRDPFMEAVIIADERMRRRKSC